MWVTWSIPSFSLETVSFGVRKVHEAQVKAHFGPFGDSANLDAR
jgi:hypothetical protein